jgi:hypothetical protein
MQETGPGNHETFEKIHQHGTRSRPLVNQDSVPALVCTQLVDP